MYCGRESNGQREYYMELAKIYLHAGYEIYDTYAKETNAINNIVQKLEDTTCETFINSTYCRNKKITIS
jgi:hypothetical protein